MCFVHKTVITTISLCSSSLSPSAHMLSSSLSFVPRHWVTLIQIHSFQLEMCFSISTTINIHRFVFRPLPFFACKCESIERERERASWKTGVAEEDISAGKFGKQNIFGAIKLCVSLCMATQLHVHCTYRLKRSFSSIMPLLCIHLHIYSN